MLPVWVVHWGYLTQIEPWCESNCANTVLKLVFHLWVESLGKWKNVAFLTSHDFTLMMWPAAHILAEGSSIICNCCKVLIMLIDYILRNVDKWYCKIISAPYTQLFLSKPPHTILGHFQLSCLIRGKWQGGVKGEKEKRTTRLKV